MFGAETAAKKPPAAIRRSDPMFAALVQIKRFNLDFHLQMEHSGVSENQLI